MGPLGIPLDYERDRHPFIRRHFGPPHYNGLVLMDGKYRRDRWHEEHEGPCPGTPECRKIDGRETKQEGWLVCHGCVCLRPAEKFEDAQRLGIDRVVG